MRRLVLAVGLTAILWSAVPAGALTVFEMGYVDAGGQPGSVDRSPSSRDPVETAPGSVRFDNLWLGIVGVVGLLLVMRIVRMESDWLRQGGTRPKTRNESRPGDVSKDE